MNKNYKKCIKCKKEFPATKEFFYKGDCKFGLRNVCKDCCSIYNKQWSKDNRDKNIQRSKDWRIKNVVHAKEYRKQRYESNKDRLNREHKEWCIKNAIYVKEYTKQYYKDNREECDERTKKWRDNNVNYIKKYTKRYNEINKEKRNEYSKKWRIKNPDRVRQYQIDNRADHNARTVRYRARKLNQTPLNTNMKIIQFYYIVATTLTDYQVDHYQPLNKGGLHHEDNLQLLEKSLNQQKGSKWPLTPEEEIKYKGYKLGSKTI